MRKDRPICYLELKRDRLALLKKRRKGQRSTGKGTNEPSNLEENGLLGLLYLPEQRLQTFKYQRQSRELWKCTTLLHRSSDKNTCVRIQTRAKDYHKMYHRINNKMVHSIHLQVHQQGFGSGLLWNGESGS